MNNRTDKICVQIPAYRDRQLFPTIKSLLEKAGNPDRLKIWVCWQHSENETIPKSIRKLKNIYFIDIPYKKSKGAGWARHLLQKKWDGEPYSFLIDSHLRLINNWDRKLIRMITDLKNSGIKKPLISSLPPPFYNPDKYPKKRLAYPMKVAVKEYIEGMLLRFHGNPIPFFNRLKKPLPGEFMAMGFVFAEGTFNKEICIDPKIYFFGDEITTGLRAYSHGYDLFHPHRIIAWHLYDRSTRIPHWDDNADWFKTNQKSYDRVRKIMQGRQKGKYGLGTTRTLEDYENFIGYKLLKDE